MPLFIDWSELSVGETYFLLGYHDPRKLLPYIETLIYAGPEIEQGETFHVFRPPTEGEMAQFEKDDEFRFLSSDPSCIGNLDGLIEELKELKARRGE